MEECVSFKASKYITFIVLVKLNWYNTLRKMAWFLSGSVWSQEFELLILVCPFQLRLLYDSMLFVTTSIQNAMRDKRDFSENHHGSYHK